MLLLYDVVKCSQRFWTIHKNGQKKEKRNPPKIGTPAGMSSSSTTTSIVLVTSSTSTRNPPKNNPLYEY